MSQENWRSSGPYLRRGIAETSKVSSFLWARRSRSTTRPGPYLSPAADSTVIEADAPVSTALAAPLGYRPVRILDDDPPLVSAESTP